MTDIPTVTMRTTFSGGHVVYKVLAGGRVVWSRRTSADRTGRAVRLAREQQRVARALVREQEERHG